jgi:hypothetical protein
LAGKVSDIERLWVSWKENPLKFVKEALNVTSVSQQQEAALEELRRLVFCKIKKSEDAKLNKEEERYASKIGISIMSGKGTGKDAWTSWVVAWFLCCFPNPKIACTAPTKHQLKDILWAEISKWLRGSEIKDFLVWQSDKVFWKESGGKEWFAVARTTNVKGSQEEQAATLAGFHEDYMCLIVDEASDVPNAVFSPLESTLTGKCNFAIVIFNPNHSSGYAIDTQFKDRAHWIPIRWNAEDSERVAKSSIEFKQKKYGRDSNYFRITVLGLPPLADPNVLIPWDWVMQCVDLEMEALDDDPEVFGLDVGGGGDPSILLRRKGPRVISLDEMNTHESEVLIGWVIRRVLDAEADLLMVDSIGIGWGVAGHLRTRLDRVKVTDVNVSESASDDERFAGLRDELWWSVRELFEARLISIPNDDVLIGELTTIKYVELPKIKVESKRDMKKRGLMSPNRADALCLTEYFSSSTRRALGGRAKQVRRGTPALSWKTI